MANKYVLIKDKEGLVNGLKTLYYTWSGENPPEDLLKLEPVHKDTSPWINYIWWTSPAPGVPSEFFAIAWIGYIEVDKPGMYRFYLTTDDGSRLWIDDELVIDAWKDQPPTTYISKSIFLSKGYHRIKYYFYNRYAFAEAVLGWIPQDGEASIVPKNKFYHCLVNEVYFTNIPEKHVVEILPVDAEKKTCVSDGEICIIKLGEEEIPLESIIRIIDDKGKIVYETPEKILVWGGDEYRLAVLN